MKKLKFAFIVLLLVSIFSTLIGCTNEPDDLPDKPNYQEVIANTNSSTNKEIVTNANVKFVFYKHDGTPCRISENFLLNRVNDGQSQYMYLEAETAEISKYVQDLVNTVVGLMQMSGNEQPLVALKDYLSARKYLTLRTGKHNDTVNAQVELVDVNSEPNFEFSDDGQEIVDFEAAWGAAKYSDFLRFQQTADVDYVKNFAVLDTLYKTISLPFDWSKAVDSLDSKPVQFGDAEFVCYDLTISSDEIKNFIKSQIQFYMSEFLVDDQENFDFMNGLYNRHVDTVLALFDIGEYKQRSYVDDNNRIVHNEVSWQITFKFDFEVLKNVLLAEGVEQTDVDQIIDMLELVNTTFISNSSKQSGLFEFGLLFEIVEDYSYDSAIIDLNDSIFTAFEVDEAGRYTIEYKYDEEKERDRWIPVNIPNKLKEMMDENTVPAE